MKTECVLPRDLGILPDLKGFSLELAVLKGFGIQNNCRFGSPPHCIPGMQPQESMY